MRFPQPRGVHRLIRGLTVALCVAALAIVNAAPASGQSADDTSHHDRALDTGYAVVLDALQRDLGLSEADAQALIESQAAALALNEELRGRLGDTFGGSWLDRQTGRLTVGVTDVDAAQLVRAAGAESRLVSRSRQALGAVKAELDRLAADSAGVMTGVTSWAVDVRENQVLVTVQEGREGAASALVDRYGDAVRIEVSDMIPTLTHHPWLDGGIPYNFLFESHGCTTGFNVINLDNRQGYFLTAGHCQPAGELAGGTHTIPFTVPFPSWPVIGEVVASFYPFFDDALVEVDPETWNQGPWVSTYPGIVTVTGWTDPPVGTAICKSGRTTQVTCGVTTLKDETVTFVDGAVVHHLTRHNACTEPGDSGGSNYTAAGTLATGTTTGGSLRGGRCLEVFGDENVSWYYPLSESLPFYESAWNVQLMTG